MFEHRQPLHSLVAATHTPFHADGELNLGVVEVQAERLIRDKVRFAFIGGTTGECHSLTVLERMELTKQWMAVVKGTSLEVVVHVGSNCIHDSMALAAHAEQLNALAVATFTPSYFKPNSVEVLVQSMAKIAAAAPRLPFYFYDIPSMTNVQLSMVRFLDLAKDRIPNLVGLKFTNSDLMTYQHLLQLDGGRWDVPFGCDEALLAATALGAKGAVGSTYNFAAPIYHRLLEAFHRNDLATAREEQYRSVRIVQKLFDTGYVGAAKETMAMIGVPVGPPRLPCASLSDAAKSLMRSDLEKMGFLDWIQSK